jgi:hypothetical protein
MVWSRLLKSISVGKLVRSVLDWIDIKVGTRNRVMVPRKVSMTGRLW